MKNPIQSKNLPFISIILGCIGLILQGILLYSGVDEKGLLITGSWPEILSWIAAGCMMILLLLGIRDLGGIPKLDLLFPPSVFAALGICTGAAGIAYTSVDMLLSASAPFLLVGAVAGIGSVLCLMALAYCRWKGHRITLFARFPLILFFCIYALSQYRTWNTSTQLMEYAFPMFATVFLLLSSYHRAALEIRLCGRKSYVFCCLAALFFCLISVPHKPFFFLPMAVWMLSESCSLKKMTKRPRFFQQETRKDG